MPAATIEARWANARPRLLELVRDARPGAGPRARRVGLGAHGPRRPLPRPPRGPRAVGRPAACPPGRGRPVRRRSARRGPRGLPRPGRRSSRRSSTRSSATCRPPPGTPNRSRPAGRCSTTSGTSPTGPRRPSPPSTSTTVAGTGWPTRTRAWTRGTSAMSRRRAPPASARPRRWSGTTPRASPCSPPSTRLSVDELRSPDGWSWAYDCLHGHTRKHLAMLGPWCVERRSA